MLSGMATHLPIKVKKVPGGFRIELADGGHLYIYATADNRVGREMPLWPEAETLAKDVARALTEAWSK
jgi:hypothetical protein